MSAVGRIPWWTWAWPALALAIMLGTTLVGATGVLAAVAAAVLILAVFAAVYHAEMIAHRIGEPFGTLVLAVAVTVIEVGLIVSIMLGFAAEKPGLARDTVFAVVMIVCNGIVGLCLLLGACATTSKVSTSREQAPPWRCLPPSPFSRLFCHVTSTTPGPVFSRSQLVFAAVISLVLYGSFVFVKTVRHRDYFLPLQAGDEAHASPPSTSTALVSLGLLVVALLAIVGLGKALTPAVEDVVAWLGAPKAVVGIAIAMLVLLPEGLAALRAARANRLQTSLNQALGSALASIGLTVPAVAVVSIALGQRLELGLDTKDTVLLVLTRFVGVITLGTGRTTVLQGIVHLVIFATFLFLAVVP